MAEFQEPKTYRDIETSKGYREVYDRIIEEWRWGTLHETAVEHEATGTVWIYRWRWQPENGQVELSVDIDVYPAERFEHTETRYRPRGPHGA